MYPRVRVTGVLIERGNILLVRQFVSSQRGWSLPGGRLEAGETIEQCLKREIREETGLEILVKRLLYLADRLEPPNHIVHITFEVAQTGGSLRVGREPEQGANPITDVQMVPLALLGQYGFSRCFAELALAGFTNAGRYVGPIANIGL